MKVSCPACDSKYTIADDKVAGRKVKVRCKSCGGQILVDGTVPAPTDSSNPPAGDVDDNDATRVFTNAERSDFDAKLAELPSADSLIPAPDAAAPETQSSELIWSVNVSETDERSLTTAQLVSAYLNGELEGEVYVWHDGLGDWSLIADVPDLTKAITDAKGKAGSKPTNAKPDTKSSPISAGSKPVNAKPDAKSTPLASTQKAEKTPAPAATLPKKTLPTAGKGLGTLATKAVPATAEKKTAARASTAKRPQSAHDIFAAASQASEDVDISMSQDEDDDQKKTGARNESSVLFSLDALKAGIVASPPQQTSASKAVVGRKTGGPPVAPKKRLEDLMSGAGAKPLASGPTVGPLMLSSNQNLLTAPAPPPPKPEPKPVVVSDVPVAGTVAVASSYAAPQKKQKKGLIIAIAAVAAVAVVAGIAIAVSGGGASEKAVASASAVKPVSTPEPVKTTEPPPAEIKQPEAVASASVAPTTAAAVVGNGTAKTGIGTGAVVAKKDAAKKDEKKEEKKTEPAGPVSSGLASFNKGAAIQALGVAASQATICKKPDGPTGTGKVTVTFAPSGRATTAVVSGGSFGGTTVGGCVSNVFKRAKVPPFEGDPVTVSKSFTITL